MTHVRKIVIIIDPANDFGSVAGWHAKDLIVRCGGRPIYSRRRKAWCTNERIASDVLAAAEADGCSVVLSVLGGDSE